MARRTSFPPTALLLVLLALAAATPRPCSAAHGAAPRLRKTESFDPAFEGWWQPPSVAAQDGKAPNMLVDAELQRRRDDLRALALEFRSPPPPPRVSGADGPSSSHSSPPSSFTKQPLARAQWNLDRIDQSFPPALDRTYAYNGSRQGQGVTIYTIDSGIIAEHDEFACDDGDGDDGACSRAEEGPVFLSEGDGDCAVGSSLSSRDIDGHGSHVASSAIGRRVGVAKRARVVAIRVLDCSGTGTIADVISALDFVRRNARKPAVVTMSLGVPSGPWSEGLEEAVRRVVVEAGVTAVVASGNSGVDACGVAPARVREAITVAATDLEGKFDGAGGEGGSLLMRRAGPLPPPPPSSSSSSSSSRLRDTVYAYSNTGPCVDILAPGVEILGACGGASRCGKVTPRAMAWATGTSMAVPHIAGAAAVYLGEHPGATPEEVRAALVGSATRGALSGDGVEETVVLEGVDDEEDGSAAAGGGRMRSTGGGGGGGASEADDRVLGSTPDLTLYTRAVAGVGDRKQ